MQLTTEQVADAARIVLTTRPGDGAEIDADFLASFARDLLRDRERVAELLAGEQFVTDAVTDAALSGDWLRAAHLIERQALPILGREAADLYDDWFDRVERERDDGGCGIDAEAA